MRVEVIKEFQNVNGEFGQEVFTFHVSLGMSSCSDITVRLDNYVERTRPTNRHGWTITAKWRRVDQRDNTCERPEITPQVALQAQHKVIARIVFDNE